MSRIPFSSAFGQEQFDPRGERLVWTEVDVRRGEAFVKVIAVRAPEWIRDHLAEELNRAGAVKAVPKNPAKWTDFNRFYEVTEITSELRRLLNLLSNVCCVGRLPTDVDHCVVLDLYKVPNDDIDSRYWTNTPAGDLINRYKYHGEGDARVQLVRSMARVIRDHPLYSQARIVLSVPGHDSRVLSKGERLASEVADETGRTFLRTEPLYRRREQAKAGSFSLQPEHVRIDADLTGHVVLVVDDVMKSGQSLQAVAAQARTAGAVGVRALVGAKTLKNR